MHKVCAVLAVLAALMSATAFAHPSPADAAAPREPCFRDASLKTGRSGGSLHSTVAPFEHFSSSRTQVFPATCSLRELTGRRRPRILARRSATNFATPYIAATRKRHELFVYGYGLDAARDGGFVARVDTRSLEQRWRVRIRDSKPARAWSYPGVVLAHGNGAVYAIYANLLVKLDARTGRTLARRELPEDPEGTGAAYNGMIVLPDGRIAAKRIERGPCAAGPAALAPVGALLGLTCSHANGLPSEIVVVEPSRLGIVQRIVTPEPVTGRITLGRHDGRAYLYIAGRDSLFRYRYRRGRMRLDRGWGPVRYRSGAEKPGTGPGLLGGHVVVQTNFLPASEPMTVTAVSVRDSRRVFRTRPFASGRGSSWIVSKAALDVANRTVVTHDTAAGQMAALRLHPRRGFSLRWRRPLSSLAFSALVGPAADREIVIPDGRGGDKVLWLELRSGRERARSAVLSPTSAPGNIVTPGFGGRFYYLSDQGALWELRPDGARPR